MQEKELIGQVRKLRYMQPDQEWVVATKTQILGEERSVFSFKAALNFKPAFLAFPMLALFLIGIFLYNNQIDQQMDELVLDSVQAEIIAAGLKAVESDLAQIAVDLERIQKPQEVLEVQKTFFSTIEKSEKVVDAVKKAAPGPRKNEQEPSVLTVLGEVESALNEVKESYLQKEKQVLDSLLEDLESRSLSEEQQAIFQQAQDYYAEGDYSRALEEALLIK